MFAAIGLLAVRPAACEEVDVSSRPAVTLIRNTMLKDCPSIRLTETKGARPPMKPSSSRRSMRTSKSVPVPAAMLVFSGTSHRRQSHDVSTPVISSGSLPWLTSRRCSRMTSPAWTAPRLMSRRTGTAWPSTMRSISTPFEFVGGGRSLPDSPRHNRQWPAPPTNRKKRPATRYA